MLITDLHDIHDEVFGAPFVEVFRKRSGFEELVWDTATSTAGIEIAVTLDGFVDDVEVSSGMASSGEPKEAHYTSYQLLFLSCSKGQQKTYHCRSLLRSKLGRDTGGGERPAAMYPG